MASVGVLLLGSLLAGASIGCFYGLLSAAHSSRPRDDDSARRNFLIGVVRFRRYETLSLGQVVALPLLWSSCLLLFLGAFTVPQLIVSWLRLSESIWLLAGYLSFSAGVVTLWPIGRRLWQKL